MRGKRGPFAAVWQRAPWRQRRAAGPPAGQGSPAGTGSPAKGLTAVTHAGTKPVSSVVWATARDVKSLDAIHQMDALRLVSMCRGSPIGSLTCVCTLPQGFDRACAVMVVVVWGWLGPAPCP